MARRRLERAGAGEAVPAAREPSRHFRRGRKTNEADPRFNLALARGLEILRAFRPEDACLGNGDLSERTGIPKATITRLTFTLGELGYLSYLPAFGKYALAPGVLGLGYTVLAQTEATVRAHPPMEALAQDFGGTVGLGMRDGLDVVILDIARGSATWTRNTAIGSRLPVVSTCVGWSLLHAAEPADRDSALAQIKSAHPGDWPRIRRRIDKAFGELDRQGFCVGVGDYHELANSTGVPFREPATGKVMGFYCSGLASALSRSELEEVWGPRLRAMAQALGGT
ncbi:MAG: IclR family transcriptional regulator [Sneathiellaceae bacterium]